MGGVAVGAEDEPGGLQTGHERGNGGGVGPLV